MRARRRVREEGFGDGLLVGDGVVDAALGASADFLEDALGRVEFGAVRRQPDTGGGQAGQQPGAMSASVIPDDGVECPGGQRRLDRPGPTAFEPVPTQCTGTGIDGQQQIRPLVLEWEPLGDRNPAWREHPPHLAAQAEPQLVGEQHAGVARHAGLDECGRHPPCFHASCAARFVGSATGRGTFGCTPSRARTVHSPHPGTLPRLRQCIAATDLPQHLQSLPRDPYKRFSTTEWGALSHQSS